MFKNTVLSELVDTLHVGVVEKIVDENILFLGDSITYAYDLDKYFEKHRVVNSSVLGVRTGGILENMKKNPEKYKTYSSAKSMIEDIVNEI